MIPLSKRFKRALRAVNNRNKYKKILADAFAVYNSEWNAIWEDCSGLVSKYEESLRDDLSERYYSDLYGGLFHSGQLLKMFPQLCGTYETDKLEWRRLVDNRDYFAEKMRDNKFKNNPIK